MKIGLFGGSFDPIHNGHLILAEQAKTQLGLDDIWFIPCGKSPYPNKKIVANIRDRINLLFYALVKEGYNIDTREMKDAISYTIESIKYYIKEFPQFEFYLIVGPDIAPENFRFWKDAEEIKKLVKVVFAGKDFWIPDIGIRSTLIRQMVKEGKSIKYLVPDSVEKYIVKKELYK